METTHQLASPTIDDGTPDAKQGPQLQTAHGGSPVTMPSASAPVVQRIPVHSGTSDSPSLLANLQEHTRRFGWSFEHIAITRDDLEPAHRYAGSPSRAQEPSSPPEHVFQPKSVEPPARKENTTGLPDHLKAGVESLSGLSLDDVHVHYNSAKPAEVQALAYTRGEEIHVGPGQEQHVAHEAWHVVLR